MKKEEIKVRITTENSIKIAENVLSLFGYKIDHSRKYSSEKCLMFDELTEMWFFYDSKKIPNRKTVSISELKQILSLSKKQTVTIEVNAHDLPAIGRVLLELSKAREKHPESSHYSGYDWHRMGSYLTEETLESIQAINDGRINDAKVEIAQTAAVCLRILSGC